MISMHHYSQYVCANHLSDNIIYKLLSSQGGYLGVAIFFLLSGYGLMESEQKHSMLPWQFVRRRLLKVYFPVLLVTLLWLPIYYYFVAEQGTINFTDVYRGYLIIKDLMFDFHDGVLWFVKALLVLYIVFFVFTYAYKRNIFFAFTILAILTFTISVICACIFGMHTFISVPMFMVGIIASACKNMNINIFNASLFALVVSFMFVWLLLNLWSCDGNMLIHCIINYIIVGAFIIICTTYKIKVSITKCLSTVSFDMYLVHNKVLTLSKCLFSIVPLWIFVLGTIISTIIYGGIRKMLKI